MSTPEISIVVPAHREGPRLRTLHAAVTAALVDVEHELVIVDDGSPDDTWEVIAGLRTEDARVRGIRLSRNFGKEAAMAAGLAHARGAAVITMDSDLQHPPAVLPRFIEAWRAGADVVDGVKATRAGQGLAHRMVSRTFNATFRSLSGVDLTEASDFKLLDRSVVDELVALPERTTFYRGLASWIGFEHATVVFDVAEREGSESRWRPTALVRFAVDAMTSFTARPLQLVSLAGAIFTLFGVALGVQTLVRFVSGQAVEGFTTVILLLLVLGGLLPLGLGVQGAYLARIHEEVKRRPRYVVRDDTD